MKSKTESAVPGYEVGPDLEAIRQQAIVRTMEQLTKPAPKIEAQEDGRDWARRIIARIEAGEDVGLQAELYAREALGLIKPLT